MRPLRAATPNPPSTRDRGEHWSAEAACHDHPEPDLWYPTAGQGGTDDIGVIEALHICATCDVRERCLEYALTHNEPGIWGGLTENQRRRLLRGRAVTPAVPRCPDCATDVSEPGRRCNPCAAKARTRQREAS